MKNDDAVQLCLEMGASFDVGHYGGSMLKTMMWSDDVNTVRHLVQRYKVDINACGSKEPPPLTYAARYSRGNKMEDISIMELLIASGASVNPTGRVSDLPLAAAATSSQFPAEKVKLLLQHGAIPAKEILVYAETMFSHAREKHEREVAVGLIRQWLHENRGE